MESTWKLLNNISSTALIEIAGIVAAFLMFWFGRRSKGLAYNILSNEQLVPLKEDIAKRVEFLIDGVPAKDVRLLLVEVENNGNEAIEEKDYERPFSITFGPQATIISAEILSTKPARILSLTAGIKINGNRLELPTRLLNPRDRLLVKILIKEHTGTITVDARIAGVREVRSQWRIDASHQLSRPTLHSALFACLILIAAQSILLRLHIQSYVAFLIAFFGTVVIAIVGSLIILAALGKPHE